MGKMGVRGINDPVYRSELIRYANTLKNNIHDAWFNRDNSYKRVLYEPTGVMIDSIIAEITPNPSPYGGREYIITLSFTESAMYANMNNTHRSFIPILMDKGWKIKGKPPMLNPSDAYLNRFWSFKGTGFISNTIKRFNDTHPHLWARFMYNGIDIANFNGGSGSLPYM